jgi:iron complex outermembrane receptor protein
MLCIQRKILALGLIITALGWLVSPVPARANSDDLKLEPVKVTAQKREEDVQKVPMSVDVVDDVKLGESRISEISDLHRIVPGLYISNSGGSSMTSYVGMRGRINSGTDVDPTVTLIVDGVPYTDAYSIGANLLYDVERVEVLRGPQSTLYGVNSVAGVINVVTRQPGETSRYSAAMEGSMGPEFDGSLRMSGSVSGPLVSEKLFGGLALMVKKRGGYIENLYSDDRYNRETLSGARGTLVWDPVDSLKLTAGLAYTDVDSRGAAILLPMNEAAAARLGQSYGEWETDIDDEGFNRVQNLAPNFKINYDAGMADIVSVSTYRKSKQDFEYDFDLTNVAAFIGVSKATSESWSQELRMQSKADNNSPFQWMTGYYHSAFARNQAIGVGDPSAPIPIMLDGELRGYGDALFAQGTYRMLDDKLGFTLGGRQEWTNRQVHDATGAFYPDAEMNDSQFLPRIAVDYRFTPAIMAYASIAQGWRSGGFNHLNTAPGKLRFKKETSWTYELGVKTRFLEDRLILNTSVYRSVYSDYQDKLRTGMMAFYLGNAKEVEMTGMEIDMESLLTENLQLLASLGYVHAEYIDYKDAINNYSGNTAVMVPDFDMSVAMKYTFLDDYYIRPEVQGVGKIYWDRLNSKSQDPYCLLNLRAGYAKDEWEVYAFGENLTNEYQFADAVDFFADGNWYGNPITPMRFGLGFNFNI